MGFQRSYKIKRKGSFRWPPTRTEIWKFLADLGIVLMSLIAVAALFAFVHIWTTHQDEVRRDHKWEKEKQGLQSGARD